MTDHPNRESALWRNRNFMLLWCAYGISAMGDHLSEMALLKTQDALNPAVDITPLAARMSFVFFLPFIFVATPAGFLADRWPRREVMVLADIVRCMLMFGFASLIAWTQDWGEWGPFAPLLFVGLFAAVFSPARSALIPSLVPRDQLVQANGMIGGLGIIATMTALLIGGFLAQHYPPFYAFRIDAGTFVASAALLLMMRLPRSIPSVNFPPVKIRVSTALAEGLRYAKSHRQVLELLAVAALVWFCGALVNSVIPAVVRDVYHGGYPLISSFRALLGVGFLLGAVMLTVLGDALRGEIVISWGLLGISLGIAIFSLSALWGMESSCSTVLGGVGVVLAGVFGVSVMSALQSLLQRTVADRFRGRVFGIHDLCSTSALLIATGLLGVPRWPNVDRWVGYILGLVALITACAGVATLVLRLQRGLHGFGLTFVQNANEFVARFWWRLKRIGPSTVPRTGPVIIAINHHSSADPLFLSAAMKYRPISFLVAAEYTHRWVIRWFMNLIECIPVKRDSGDLGATKQALRHLRSGKVLGLFVQGGIVAPNDEAELKDGAAVLALRTGAVVIPTYISGTEYHESLLRGLMARHHARVRFGAPVDLMEFSGAVEGGETIRAATRKIYAAILALAPAAHSEKNP